MDRASGCGPEGQKFESSRSRHYLESRNAFFVQIVSLIFLSLYVIFSSETTCILYQEIHSFLRINTIWEKGISPLQISPYKIAEGENLWNLAREKTLHMDSLLSLNSFKNAHVIRNGDVIYIPNVDGICISPKYSEDLELSIDDASMRYDIDKDFLKMYNDPTEPLLQKLGVGSTKIFIPWRKFSLGEMIERLGLKFSCPLLHYRLTSHWGFRMHPISKNEKLHRGIDLAAPMNTRIFSAMAGIVIYADYSRSFGNCVVIKHRGGYGTRYAHMQSVFVKTGQKVGLQEPIGTVGKTGTATGPHLHFEILKDNRSIDPRGLVLVQTKVSSK